MTHGWKWDDINKVWFFRQWEFIARQLILTRDYVAVIRSNDGDILFYADIEGVAVVDCVYETTTLTDEQKKAGARPGRGQVDVDKSRGEIVAVILTEGSLECTRLSLHHDYRGFWEIAHRSEVPPGMRRTWIGLTKDWGEENWAP